jgi:hypothetical protein
MFIGTVHNVLVVVQINSADLIIDYLDTACCVNRRLLLVQKNILLNCIRGM